MSEKAVAAEGVSLARQLGIARGGKLSNVSVSLPEGAHTTFCEQPASPEPPAYGGCGRKPPEGHLTAGRG